MAPAVFKTVVPFDDGGWVRLPFASAIFSFRGVVDQKDTREVRHSDPRRMLPSVSVVLECALIAPLFDLYPRVLVLDAVRDALQAYRDTLPTDSLPLSVDDVAERACELLEQSRRDDLRPVVNATGIILHTGLGRAVLPKTAVHALSGLDRCCNLQIDLDTGRRGKRNYAAEQLLCRLTGAESAMVVNNNAAATLLVLTALCAQREVIVSRGQLIEIGGSYRLPDCIHQSGAQLVEVGTTNKTHLHDYARAITPDTSAVMRVNPSNYRIVGFSKEVSIRELVTLKKSADILVIDDLGCGALIDLSQYGLPKEPTVQESIEAGADIALFSGDKLIGGPQSGIIVGKEDLIRMIRKHPLTRMLRVDKMTDMALQETLRLFLEPERLPSTHPTIAMLATPVRELRRLANSLMRRIVSMNSELGVSILDDESAVGGGSVPAESLPTCVVALTHPKMTANALSRALRLSQPPVIGRISDNAVLLDVRTLLPGDDVRVVEAIQQALVAISKMKEPLSGH